MLVCHQYDVCKNYLGSVYVAGYGSLSERATNFPNLMIILLLYVEAHIFILETLEKLGIYYPIMLVLLIFMHLLFAD